MKKLVFILLSVLSLPFMLGASDYIPFSYPYYNSHTGKWGYYYAGNQEVRSCYEDIAPLNRLMPYFWAKKDGKWGMCTADNSIVIPFEFEDVCVNPFTMYGPDSIMIKTDARETFGEVKKPAFQRKVKYAYFPTCHGTLPLFPVKKNGEWGYVDAKGQEVIPFGYKQAFIFEKYLSSDKNRAIWIATVRDAATNKLRYIDLLGNDLIADVTSDVVSDMLTSNGTIRISPKEKKIKKYLKKIKPETRRAYEEIERKTMKVFDKLPVSAPYIHTYAGEVKIDSIVSVTKAKTAKKTSRNRKTQARTVAKPGKKYYTITFGDKSTTIDSIDRFLYCRGDVLCYVKKGRHSLLNLGNGFSFACDSMTQMDETGEIGCFFTNDSVPSVFVNIRGSLRHPKNYDVIFADMLMDALKAKDESASKIYLQGFINHIGSPYEDNAMFIYDGTINEAIKSYEMIHDANVRAQLAEQERQNRATQEAAKPKAEETSLLDDVLGLLGDVAELIDGASGNSNVSYAAPAVTPDYEEYEDDDSSSGTKRKKTQSDRNKKKTINASIYNSYQRELNSIANQLNDYKIKKSNDGLSSNDLSRIRSLKRRAREIRNECKSKYGETLPSNSIENWNP